MNIRLSKTKYLNGLQCKKLLWYIYNEPTVIPEPDEATQAVFEQGHLVGDYAKKLFSKGVEVDHTKSFDEGLRQTTESSGHSHGAFDNDNIFLIGFYVCVFYFTGSITFVSGHKARGHLHA